MRFGAHVPDSQLGKGFGEKVKHAVIAAAHEKAKAMLDPDDMISPDQFDHFDTAMIARDMQYVEEREALFAETETEESAQRRMAAEVLEAIITEQTELANWLGENVSTVRASRYDDIANGVDTIAEFSQETSTSYLALAIDATYADPSEKLARIRKEIDRGTLTQVKYFRSSDGTYIGSLQKIPRVVIGVSYEQIVELAKLWVNGKKDELAMHPVQLQIIEEIILQLRVYMAYAAKLGKTDIVEIYQRQLRLVESVGKTPEKRKVAAQHGVQDFRAKDKVFDRLVAVLRTFGE